ncbi:MAG: DUF3048 domain-containing protein [Lachnospiraceae bacterium]|nr:DUF3048 domain-containing protein [Lachnospiraceae bacterium]
MKKKPLLLLLSAVLACGLMIGCGSSSEEETRVTTVDLTEELNEENGSTTDEVEANQEAEETAEEESREGMYRSELTNEWIDEALMNQRPVAIMVDNESTALDHYGLTQADIVYEIMNSTANGEITRFMCIVKDWGSITQFGSIRSTRPTNLMIAPEYNAVLIHDGGPFYIDAYLTNAWVDHLSGGFSRIANGKAYEFTEYVTTGEIESRLSSAGISSEYNEWYQGAPFQFADETNPVDLSAESDSITCTLVDLPFPHNSSQLDYDEESGTYLYSEYGKAHVDLANDSAQLAFTNVILECASVTQYDENGYMQFNILNESGKGYYITGGSAIPITWSKGWDYEQTKYYDMDGNEITLNTGKTYIALVSESRWDELVLK